MSIFGPVDDDDLRIWQQRGLKGLTDLVQLGVKKKLPPLLWTLPDLGDISGKFSPLGRRGHEPRGVFEAWLEALSRHQRVEPIKFGLNGEGEHRTERTFPGGQTRLGAVFKWHLRADSQHPSCKVVILAEWYAEDLVGAVEP